MKIYRLLLPLILILNACFVQAPLPVTERSVTAQQQTPMLSFLGGAKYPTVVLDNARSGWGMTFFTSKDTFGDAKPLIEKVLAKGKTPVIKLNLMWKDDHKFSRADFPKIVAEGKRFNDVILRNPGTRFYVLGATEHNLNQRDAQDLANQVLAAMPQSIQYINNPWTGALLPTTDRILNEIHGSKAKRPQGRYTFDCDGSSDVDIDISSLKKKFFDAELFGYWHPSHNGRLAAGDTTPRPQRKSWPTDDLIASEVFLLTEKGQTEFKKNAQGIERLYKSHSDRHNTPPEARAYKPVVIIPDKVSYLELIAANGKSIAKSGAPMSYEDGRKRYYFTEFGYKYARKAQIQAGSPVCIMKAGSKIIGKINPGFRAGGFRE